MLILSSNAATAATLLASRFRQGLDPFQSYASLGLEVRHTQIFSPSYGLALFATGERQWTATLPSWAVPSVGASAWVTSGVLAMRLDVAALGLERWDDRGALGEAGLWALATFGSSSPVREIAVQDRKSLAFTMGAGLFFRFAQFKTDFEGRPLVARGVRERAELEGRWGRFGGALAVTLEQRFHENDPVHLGYAVRERLRFFINHEMAVGIEHESLGNLYDENTGRAAPLQLADRRTSRLGAFLEARW